MTAEMVFGYKMQECLRDECMFDFVTALEVFRKNKGGAMKPAVVFFFAPFTSYLLQNASLEDTSCLHSAQLHTDTDMCTVIGYWVQNYN